ncbi:hypothetical protein [Pseudomonas citronellolis]|uniref:hypothetical protein n=1 Tax=Pseudomonas citronellolis TaxID=53408 RepID=UPI000A5F6A86
MKHEINRAYCASLFLAAYTAVKLLEMPEQTQRLFLAAYTAVKVLLTDGSLAFLFLAAYTAVK